MICKGCGIKIDFGEDVCSASQDDEDLNCFINIWIVCQACGFDYNSSIKEEDFICDLDIP